MHINRQGTSCSNYLQGLATVYQGNGERIVRSFLFQGNKCKTKLPMILNCKTPSWLGSQPNENLWFWLLKGAIVLTDNYTNSLVPYMLVLFLCYSGYLVPNFAIHGENIVCVIWQCLLNICLEVYYNCVQLFCSLQDNLLCLKTLVLKLM